MSTKNPESWLHQKYCYQKYARIEIGPVYDWLLPSNISQQ